MTRNTSIMADEHNCANFGSRQKRASLAVLALVAVPCICGGWSMSATTPLHPAPATRGLVQESRPSDNERREIDEPHVTD